MEFYETDLESLQKFIENEKIDGAFSENYLILYNFATDLKYSTCIQPALIQYLLPFYFKAMEQAVFYRNRTAIDIYYEFNQAMFCNQSNIKSALGEKDYQCFIEYYISQTIRKMERTDLDITKLYMLEWVSLFNTTVAFCEDAICLLFERIFQGSLRIKYAFFRYLSVLLFKESDNLLAVNESLAFWTSDIFDFDAYSNTLFWSDIVIKFFDEKINKELIEAFYKEVQPLLYHILEPEFIDIFREEMDKSFAAGIFYDRKAEYLEKMGCKDRESMEDTYWYWDSTF